MSRVTDALDAFLGTTSPRGGIVQRRDGVFTDGDGLAPADPLEALSLRSESTDEDACSPRRHRKLRGDRRCHGCGRTRNEIETDGRTL